MRDWYKDIDHFCTQCGVHLTHQIDKGPVEIRVAPSMPTLKSAPVLMESEPVVDNSAKQTTGTVPTQNGWSNDEIYAAAPTVDSSAQGPNGVEHIFEKKDGTENEKQ